jgi:small-conductance mechanosensitive channel
VFCLLCFARTVILWLEAKAKETDIHGDDTVERFAPEGIGIPFPEREAWLKK